MSKAQKRLMKLNGFLTYMYSLSLLRYTTITRRQLAVQIKALEIKGLHVGCGNVLINGWLNILFEKRQEYGRLIKKGQAWWLNYNLLKAWPVDGNSVNFVAGSHFIEHLDLNQGISFVTQAFRVLKPKGRIRLSCPDLEVYAKNYVANNTEFFNHPKIREWCAFKAAVTPGEIFVAKAYDSGGAHKWFYDFASLKHILESAGFTQVKRVGRLEGGVEDLAIIEPAGRELETIYVEAQKP